MANVNPFVRAIDVQLFAVRSNVQIQQGFERGWGLYGQRITRTKLAANKLRQPAVGKRDIGTAFDHRDLSRLAQTTGTRRTRRTRRNTTNNK